MTLAISATSAFAWGDMYMGDGTNNPNSGQVYAYPGENNCPTGMRPIVMGGVICCGTPTASGYGDYTPMPRTKKKRGHTHKHVHHVTHKHSHKGQHHSH